MLRNRAALTDLRGRVTSDVHEWILDEARRVECLLKELQAVAAGDEVACELILVETIPNIKAD
ncbi:hypothetical protein F1880_006649 [Penicillium rolfsii]|nr:hypothetical protein F1880_006649 [Penicillium rolfsii]